MELDPNVWASWLHNFGPKAAVSYARCMGFSDADILAANTAARDAAIERLTKSAQEASDAARPS